MQIELLGVRQQSHKEAKWEKPLATTSTEGEQWSMRQFREFISGWRAKQEQRGLKECSGLYICSCIRGTVLCMRPLWQKKCKKTKFPELNIKQASGEKVIKPFLAGLHQVLHNNTEIIKWYRRWGLCRLERGKKKSWSRSQTDKNNAYNSNTKGISFHRWYESDSSIYSNILH